MKVLLLLVGIFVSLTGFAQTAWTPCAPPVSDDFFCGQLINEQELVVAGRNGIFLESHDYGSIFTLVITGSTEDIEDIYFFHPDTGYVLQGEVIMKTTTGGNSWNTLFTFPEVPLAFHFNGRNNIFVSCENGEAFKSFNGGISWTSMNTGSSRDLYAISFPNNTQGYIGGKNNTSLFSNDGGNNFIDNVIPCNEDILDLFFVDQNKGWSGGKSGEVFRSNSINGPWAVQNIPSQEDVNAIYFSSNQNGFMACSGGDILVSHDGGNSWINDNSGINDDLLGIHVIDSLHGIAFGNAGTLLKLSIPNQAGIKETTQNSLLMVPNPANTYAKIKNPSIVEPGEIQIIDSRGNTVQKMNILMGISEFEINTASLVNGIYFLQIFTSEKIQHAQFSVQH